MGKSIFGYEEDFVKETTSDYCQCSHITVPINGAIGNDFWCDVKDGSSSLLEDEEIFDLI